MPDRNICIEKNSQLLFLARFFQVSDRILDHVAPFFRGGTGTLPASSRNDGTLARTARSLWTLNKTLSPALRPSASRRSFGSVTCPFEVTVAGISNS